MASNGDPFDPALVIFAALALFVIWKLRSVLGMRVEREEGPRQFGARPSRAGGPAPLAGAATYETPAEKKPVAERWDGVAERGVAAAWTGLDAIASADPQFDGKAFLDGARRAYEMIVDAFAKGDRDSLRSLLSASVFDGFASEIARREAAGETMETAVVAIDSASVVAARTAPGLNEITVRLVVRLSSVRRDRAGETLEGGQTRRMVERWTFARDPKASEPNWKLTATQGED